MRNPLLVATLFTITALSSASTYATEEIVFYNGANLKKTNFTNTLFSSHVTGFANVNSVTLNLSQVSDTGGYDNRFFNDFGAYVDLFGRIQPPSDYAPKNITGNRVITTATNSMHNMVRAHFGNNTANNTIQHTLTNTNGWGSDFLTVISNPTGLLASNNSVITNLTGDVTDNRVYILINANANSNIITNTLTNSYKNNITTSISGNALGQATSKANENKVSNIIGNSNKASGHNQVGTYINLGSVKNTVTNTINGYSNNVTNLLGASLNNNLPVFGNPLLAQENTAYVNINGDSNTVSNTLTRGSRNTFETRLGNFNNQATMAFTVALESNKVINTIGNSNGDSNANRIRTILNYGAVNNNINTKITGNGNLVKTGIGVTIVDDNTTLWHDPKLMRDNIVNVSVVGDSNNISSHLNGSANTVNIIANNAYDTRSNVVINGDANMAGIYTTGSSTFNSPGQFDGQFAQIVINGANNKGVNGYMVQQFGVENEADLRINGNNNTARVYQSGTNNTARLNLNCTGCVHDLKQIGNNMTANVTRTQ